MAAFEDALRQSQKLRGALASEAEAARRKANKVLRKFYEAHVVDSKTLRDSGVEGRFENCQIVLTHWMGGSIRIALDEQGRIKVGGQVVGEPSTAGLSKLIAHRVLRLMGLIDA